MPYVVKWKDGSSTQMDDKEFENLPSDMEEDIGSIEQTRPDSTYAYAKPDDYEMLKRNLGEVGYSGLDETQKGLFKSQFANSKFARAGGKFEDAVKYVDEQSNASNPSTWDNVKTVVGAMPQAAFQAARDVISYPVSAGLSYLDAMQTHEGVDAAGRAIPRYEDNPSYLERLGRSQEELRGEAQRNEGLPGMLSNPTNLIGFGLGKGAIATGEKVIPSILKGFGQGAAENTGLSVFDQYMNTGKVDPFATGVAGLTGGLIGAGARPFRVQQGRYDAHAAEQKLADEDFLSFVFDRMEAPQGQAVSKKMDELIAEADPADLYTQYQYALQRGKGTKLDVGEQANLMKSTKKAIAENSRFNRKMSTITDREAREYLEGIVRRVGNIRMGSETGLVDLSINAPKPLTKSISDASKTPEAAIATGLIAGIPGLLTRHAINLPSIANKSDRLLSKLSTSKLASGLGNAVITNTTSEIGRK